MKIEFFQWISVTLEYEDETSIMNWSLHIAEVIESSFLGDTISSPASSEPMGFALSGQVITVYIYIK